MVYRFLSPYLEGERRIILRALLVLMVNISISRSTKPSVITSDHDSFSYPVSIIETSALS